MVSLERILAEVRACRVCETELPLGPRPIVRAQASARLLIIGQAPGIRVHETGIPFNDRSGDRLRQWLALDRDRFYDEKSIAFIPAGFCYPGTDKSGGDLPPRKECAPLWHAKLRASLPNIRLTLLVGSYAQRIYLKDRRKGTVGKTVEAWREYLPEFLPLPHPSWRNTAWLRRNSWFEKDLVPELRDRVARLARLKIG